MIINTYRIEDLDYEYIEINPDSIKFKEIKVKWINYLQAFIYRFIGDIQSSNYHLLDYGKNVLIYEKPYRKYLQNLNKLGFKQVRLSNTNLLKDYEFIIELQEHDTNLIKQYYVNYMKFTQSFITNEIDKRLNDDYFLNIDSQQIILPENYKEFINFIKQNPFKEDLK